MGKKPFLGGISKWSSRLGGTGLQSLESYRWLWASGSVCQGPGKAVSTGRGVIGQPVVKESSSVLPSFVCQQVIDKSHRLLFPSWHCFKINFCSFRFRPEKSGDWVQVSLVSGQCSGFEPRI